MPYSSLFTSAKYLAKNEKVCQWEGHLCQCLSTYTSQRAQLRAPLSPYKQPGPVWTLINISSGSSSSGPALVEIATARSFILNGGIVADTVSATPPGARMVSSAFHSTKAFVSQVGAPADGLAGLWGLTVKAQCLSACLPPKHPNSLWLSYRPRVVGIGFSQTQQEWC